MAGLIVPCYGAKERALGTRCAVVGQKGPNQGRMRRYAYNAAIPRPAALERPLGRNGGGAAMCCDAVIVAAAAIGGRVFGEEAG